MQKVGLLLLPAPLPSLLLQEHFLGLRSSLKSRLRRSRYAFLFPLGPYQPYNLYGLFQEKEKEYLDLIVIISSQQTVRKRAEVNTADQIALLEATRGQLLSQKMYLEQKIGELQERQRKKKEADRERERMMEIAGRSVER